MMAPWMQRNRPRLRWSLWSEDSFLSIGCKGSILSIGSVGSACSIGSIGSFLSAFSIGSALSLGSVLSALSRFSAMSHKGDRGVMAELVPLRAALRHAVTVIPRPGVVMCRPSPSLIGTRISQEPGGTA